MEESKFKLRRNIKIKTIVPIVAIIMIVITLAIGSIISDSKKADVIFEMAIPLAVVIIILFLAHGYAWHMALVEEVDIADYFREKYKIGFLSVGFMAAIASLASYIGIFSNIGDSLLVYHNVVFFFIALAQVFLAGLCIGASNSALETKSDRKMSEYYILKAGKYKYFYISACFIVIVFTYFLV